MSETQRPTVGVPAGRLFGWMTRAALLGLFVGTAAGIAALLT